MTLLPVCRFVEVELSGISATGGRVDAAMENVVLPSVVLASDWYELRDGAKDCAPASGVAMFEPSFLHASAALCSADNSSVGE